MARSPFHVASGKTIAPAGAAMSGPDAEQRVVTAVVDAILNHRIGPGERLIERELGKYSGASRTAIRNGMLKLAHAGLVELSPNRGATIAMCSPDEAREIFDARIVIEDASLRRLATSLTAAGFEQLEAIVSQESDAYEAGEMEQARHLSRRFHLLFTELAGNDVLTRIIRDLINRQPLLSWTRPQPAPRFCGNTAHSAILAALARGDGVEAARLNTEHLRELERELDADRDAAIGDVGHTRQKEAGDVGTPHP